MYYVSRVSLAQFGRLVQVLLTTVLLHEYLGPELPVHSRRPPGASDDFSRRCLILPSADTLH